METKEKDELLDLLREHECHRVANLLNAYGEEFVIKDIYDGGLLKIQDISIATFKEFEKILELAAKEKGDDSCVYHKDEQKDDNECKSESGKVADEKAHL